MYFPPSVRYHSAIAYYEKRRSDQEPLQHQLQSAQRLAVAARPERRGGSPRFARFDNTENGIRALQAADQLPRQGRYAWRGRERHRYRARDHQPLGTEQRERHPGLCCCRGQAPGRPGADPIDIKDPATLRKVVLGIIIHESGGNLYPLMIIDECIRRALA